MSRPYLILLDLNLPRMNGIEFLQALRQDDTLSDSIVFVLTTSDRDEDKVAAYALHIAGYLRKDRVGENCRHLITLLQVYGQLVEFPLHPAYD